MATDILCHMPLFNFRYEIRIAAYALEIYKNQSNTQYVESKILNKEQFLMPDNVNFNIYLVYLFPGNSTAHR